MSLLPPVLTRMLRWLAANGIAQLENMGELLDQLGGISPRRVRLHPTPGTATETDLLLRSHDQTEVACELVNGVLVEKVMGYSEASPGYACRPSDPGLPSTSTILGDLSWRGRLHAPAGPGWCEPPASPSCAGRSCPAVASPPTDPRPGIPDLATEVLSEGNTPAEMESKRGEYFRPGRNWCG